jgi:hypothetical protein
MQPGQLSGRRRGRAAAGVVVRMAAACVAAGGLAAEPALAAGGETIQVQAFSVTAAPPGAGATAALAAAPDGSGELFALTQGGSDGIWRITTDGVITQLGTVGAGTPVGIAGISGGAWLVSTSPAAVVGLGSTGKGHTTTPLAGDPRDIAAGPDGNLYVADHNGNIIQISTAPGATPQTFADTVAAPAAPDSIASAAGKLWLTDDRANLASMTTSGLFAGPFAQAGSPSVGNASRGAHTMSAGTDGYLYLVGGGVGARSGSEILRINPSTGAAAVSYGLPQGSAVTSLTTGSDGNLWFTDQNPARPSIDELDPTTGQVEQFPVPGGYTMPAVGSVAIEPGPAGTVWFSLQAQATGEPAIGEVSGLTHPGPTNHAPPAAKLTLPGSASVSASGVASIRVGCRGARGQRCAGRLTLTAVLGPKRSRPVTIGSGGYRVATGRSGTVEVKLTAAGRSAFLAATRHRLKVTATARPTAGGKASRTVMLIPAR